MTPEVLCRSAKYCFGQGFPPLLAPIVVQLQYVPTGE